MPSRLYQIFTLPLLALRATLQTTKTAAEAAGRAPKRRQNIDEQINAA